MLLPLRLLPRPLALVPSPSFLSRGPNLSSFRTEVSDPRLHGQSHVARYYTPPTEVSDALFKFAGFTAKQREMMSVLDDRSIMVREPALEIIRLLKRTDFSRPVNRFVICKFRVLPRCCR